MATFRIHEDREKSAGPGAGGRRALGELPRLAGNLQHAPAPPQPHLKLGKLNVIPTTHNTKSNDENKVVRQINEKNIVPPVAQFRAFSVYEDKPSEAEPKKKEPTFKPFSAAELKRASEVVNAENIVPKAQDVERKSEAAVLPRLPLQDKIKDPPLESPMSVTQDCSVLSMSLIENETLNEYEETDKVVAQSAREMFFHVVEYRQDIYEYMREIEVKHRASPRYMLKQPDINYGMRAILVDWLCEVCEEYSQQSETLHLAVSYVDRFLSFMSVVRAKLQLVGTAATFIAAKYEEVYPPDVGEFVYITDDTYTKREVLRMEHLILKVLSFDLSTPTALAFLSLFCISNGLSQKIFHLASYISELSLLEGHPYLQYKSSVIAASALATARHCLMCKRCGSERPADVKVQYTPHPDCVEVAWTEKLVDSTGYEIHDLEPCMRELARTHSHVSQQPHQAIPDKYKNNKLSSVSTIEARPMYQIPAAPVPPPAAPAPRSEPPARPAQDKQRPTHETVRIS